MVGSKCRDFKNLEVSNVNAPNVYFRMRTTERIYCTVTSHVIHQYITSLFKAQLLDDKALCFCVMSSLFTCLSTSKLIKFYQYGCDCGIANIVALRFYRQSIQLVDKIAPMLQIKKSFHTCSRYT